MSSLESMINKLSPLGVYNLSEDSVVYAELAAFSAGLDIIRETLDLLLKENFIATAEDFGIEVYEHLVGTPRKDLPLEKRRQMLLERLSMNTDDFTPDGFEKMQKMLGVEGSIEEYPESMRVTLNFSQDSYSYAQKEWIATQAKALFPAHIESDIVFAGVSFAG